MDLLLTAGWTGDGEALLTAGWNTLATGEVVDESVMRAQATFVLVEYAADFAQTEYTGTLTPVSVYEATLEAS
jgi:hypothetical protein